MNYIKRLQGEVKDRQEQREEALEALNDLLEYLGSGKFRCGDDLDGYVSVQDVFNRLAPVRQALGGI